MHWRAIQRVVTGRLLAIIIMAVAAHGETVVEDTFSRSGLLDGSSPDRGEARWSVTGKVVIEDNQARFTSNAASKGTNTVASYPVKLAPKKIYTLSATLSESEGGWLALGFGTEKPGALPGGYAWMLQHPSDLVEIFRGPGSQGGSLYSSAANANTKKTRFKITLNTDTKEVSFYVNNVLKAQETIADLPEITHLFLHGRDVTGSVSHFRLEDEPSR